MEPVSTLTQSRLKELLHYNPDTGIFTWFARPVDCSKNERNQKIWNLRFTGTAAGSVCQGYVYIRICGKGYRAHRLAFLYMTGRFPVEQVDHINGQPADNRWVNLRPVSGAENSKNQRLRSANTSGYIGVSWDARCKKWAARIRHKGTYMHLGVFAEKSKAIAARKAAEAKFNFHPNHGRTI